MRINHVQRYLNAFEDHGVAIGILMTLGHAYNGYMLPNYRVMLIWSSLA
jgi:hypothetical protein